MSHQKDCYQLGVVSYSSDRSGDRVSPLVGVPEAVMKHDRVAGHATPQHNDRLLRLRRVTTKTEQS